jgi:hypothetical protein
VKNKINISNTTESFFVLQTALKQVSSNINLKGLLEVVLKTENPELAVRMIAGDYKTPNLAKQVILLDNNQVGKAVCSLIEYNPWENMVSFSYMRNKKKHIYVSKDCNDTITEENYKNYEKSWNSSETKSITVVLTEKELATDIVTLQTWMDAEVVIADKQEFSKELDYSID